MKPTYIWKIKPRRFNMIGYIYKITNIKTGQNYIGQTINLNQRKTRHFSTLRNNHHDNPKMQASWNKYGEENFTFEYWTFPDITREELDRLECEYIEKFDGLTEGFNLMPGGGRPPLHQKVLNDDIVTFLCVQNKLGDGYGKTCEQIFGWAKGTASVAKRKKRFLTAWEEYDKLSDEQKDIIANDFIESQHLKEAALQRQLTQGGCAKAYQLTKDDYMFAFAAQTLGYSYTEVANYLGIKPATVKDWFNGRSRKKEREQFNNLSQEELNTIIGRVKIAELSGKPKSESSN